jgi:hypothetical protein
MSSQKLNPKRYDGRKRDAVRKDYVERKDNAALD